MRTEKQRWAQYRALGRLSRPDQLGLIVVVYGMGAAMAMARTRVGERWAVFWGLGALLPLAVSVHVVNEYADYETDKLTTRTRFSGGSGALHRFDRPQSVAWRAAVGSLGVGALLSSAAFLAGMLEAWSLGMLALIVVLGWAYSVGPYPLIRTGWGEFTNALLGGVLLPVYGYTVLAGQPSWWVILACLPFGFVVFSSVLSTQWPDRLADEAVGKRTLPTRWSPEGLRIVYRLSGSVGFGLLIALAGTLLPLVVVFCSMAGFPALVVGSARVTRQESPTPSVVAMVVVAVGQLVGWVLEAGLLGTGTPA